MARAKGKDIRILAHKIARIAQSISGAWNFSESIKNPKPRMSDGIARCMFPEKAIRRFISPLSFDFSILCSILKFLRVSLMRIANKTVKMLETVAIIKLVMRDFKNRVSLKILLKSAPKPSTKTEIRGKTKRIVEQDMIKI